MWCTMQQDPLNNTELVYVQLAEQEGHLVVTTGQRAETSRSIMCYSRGDLSSFLWALSTALAQAGLTAQNAVENPQGYATLIKW